MPRKPKHTGNRPDPQDDRFCDGEDCPICELARENASDVTPEALPDGLDEQGRDADGNQREYWA